MKIDIPSAREMCEKLPTFYIYSENEHLVLAPGGVRIAECWHLDYATFIVAARELLPQALNEIERLQRNLTLTLGLTARVQDERDRLREQVASYRDEAARVVRANFVLAENARLTADLEKMTQQDASLRDELADTQCRYCSLGDVFDDQHKQNIRLRADLAAMTAARDEACNGWDRTRQPNPYDKGDRERIVKLRAVGSAK